MAQKALAFSRSACSMFLHLACHEEQRGGSELAAGQRGWHTPMTGAPLARGYDSASCTEAGLSALWGTVGRYMQPGPGI